MMILPLGAAADMQSFVNGSLPKFVAGIHGIQHQTGVHLVGSTPQGGSAAGEAITIKKYSLSEL
jgi:hypothetical protein